MDVSCDQATNLDEIADQIRKREEVRPTDPAAPPPCLTSTPMPLTPSSRPPASSSPQICRTVRGPEPPRTWAAPPRPLPGVCTPAAGAEAAEASTSRSREGAPDGRGPSGAGDAAARTAPLSVVSWRLMTDGEARATFSAGPGAKLPDAMLWQWRVTSAAMELRNWDADIVLLQNVEEAQYAELELALTRLGYAGQRALGLRSTVPDRKWESGLAIFFKADQFELLQSKTCGAHLLGSISSVTR